MNTDRDWMDHERYRLSGFPDSQNGDFENYDVAVKNWWDGLYFEYGEASYKTNLNVNGVGGCVR